MKRLIKILVISLLIMVVTVVVFIKTSVGDKSIYISTGFDGNTMIKIAGYNVTKSEVLIYMTDSASDYIQLFGDQIVNDSIEGVPFEEYIKSLVKGKLTRLSCMLKLALERGIVLSNQEQAGVDKAATEYYESISPEYRKNYAITYEDIRIMYQNLCIADKLYDDLTYDVDIEISEDEARVIKIQYAKFASKEEAQSAKLSLDVGASFSSLIRQNNPYEYEAYISRGEMEEEFEKAAFALSTGEVSDVVETSGSGYYLVMCVNDYDKNKTASNKEVMVNELKLEKFNSVFQPYEAQQYAEYNEKLWDELTIDSLFENCGGFSTIYHKYFDK